MSNREVEIEVTIKCETEKAYLVHNGENEAWIAKSQIKDYTEESDGSISSILIAEWLGIEKGLI